MRKHRFIGFVLTAATVAGPLSLSATTPASAAVVITDGVATWRPLLINLPLSLPQVLPAPGSVAPGSQPLTALFNEFGTALPLYLGGIENRRPAELERLASVQLNKVRMHANAVALAQLAAAKAAAPAPARPVIVEPVTAPASAPTPAPTASGDVWAELRDCESGGNYAEDTGNGFYGAYQFAPSTWTGLGYPGLPSDAPPAVQDAAAQQLQARSGWGQWPGCSAKLGL
jgi:hypothetical protein